MPTQTQRPRSPQRRPSRPPQRRFPVVPVAIGGIVLLAVIAVVLTSLGGGKKTPVDDRPNLEQNRPVSVSGTALARFSDATPDPAVGQPAPTINGQAFDGTPITVANDGSPKVILFVAHWCPHCQKEVPLLAGWMKTHPLPAGVKLFTVSTGVSESAPNFPPSAWLQREEWRVPTIADDAKTTAANAYGLSSYPYFVAVDSAGRVVQRASGELPIAEWEAVLAKTAAAPAAG